LFINAIDKIIEMGISIISVIEIYYISIQEQNEYIAKERIELIYKLPVTIFDVNFESALVAGSLKAKNRISFADSCIAGLALAKKSILVHKDPEYEQLTDIEQLKLKYK